MKSIGTYEIHVACGTDVGESLDRKLTAIGFRQARVAGAHPLVQCQSLYSIDFDAKESYRAVFDCTGTLLDEFDELPLMMEGEVVVRDDFVTAATIYKEEGMRSSAFFRSFQPYLRSEPVLTRSKAADIHLTQNWSIEISRLCLTPQDLRISN